LPKDYLSLKEMIINDKEMYERKINNKKLAMLRNIRLYVAILHTGNKGKIAIKYSQSLI
jgi:hypothetical protein